MFQRGYGYYNGIHGFGQQAITVGSLTDADAQRQAMLRAEAESAAKQAQEAGEAMQRLLREAEFAKKVEEEFKKKTGGDMQQFLADGQTAEAWFKKRTSRGLDCEIDGALKFVPEKVAAALTRLFTFATDESDVSLKEKTASKTVFSPAQPGSGTTKLKLAQEIRSGKALLIASDSKPEAPVLALVATAQELASLAGTAGKFCIVSAPAVLVKAAKVLAVSAAATARLGTDKELVLGFQFESPAAQRMNRVGQVVVGTAAIYHGYKRNESVGWALVWGVLGSAFWPVAAPVMLAQGFGKPAKK